MIPFPDRNSLLQRLSDSGLPITWHLPLNDGADAFIPWQDRLLEHVAQFASFLLTHPQSRERAELVALGFWFRRSNLHKLAAQVTSDMKQEKREGKIFHIAPANVDTVFMYSVLLSVLAGNQNVVRVSSRSGELCWLLLDLLKLFIAQYPDHSLASQIAVMEYDAQYTHVTELVSLWCDIRVVWGGDSAIAAVADIVPDTVQVSFPDRFSIVVLQLDDKDDLNQLASRLLADVLPFNQQACSSPRAVYWLNTSTQLQSQFWIQCQRQIEKVSHSFTTADTMEQLVLLQSLTMRGLIQPATLGDEFESHMSMQCAHILGPICRVNVESVSGEALANHRGHGFILETQIGSLTELPTHQKLQTVLSNIPFTEDEITTVTCKRIAPVGNALTFDANWDGVNLLRVFSELATPHNDHGAD